YGLRLVVTLAVAVAGPRGCSGSGASRVKATPARSVLASPLKLTASAMSSSGARRPSGPAMTTPRQRTWSMMRRVSPNRVGHAEQPQVAAARVRCRRDGDDVVGVEVARRDGADRVGDDLAVAVDRHRGRVDDAPRRVRRLRQQVGGGADGAEGADIQAEAGH